VIGRLADAFAFFVLRPDAFEAGTKYLLAPATADQLEVRLEGAKKTSRG
jgi:hypothetical protein